MDTDKTIGEIAKDQILAQVKVIKPQPGDIVVAKLGTADMGDGLLPWIPTYEDMMATRDDLALVVPDDVKVLVYHMGLEFEVLRDLSDADRILVTQA